MKLSNTIIWIALLLVFSCGNKQEKQFSLENDKMEMVIVIPDSLPTYHELIQPIQQADVEYQKDLLTVLPEMSESREQLAMQTGVIIADLAYLRYFERVSESKVYAELLDERLLTLDIPQDEVRTVVEQIETHMYSTDTLMHVLSSGFDNLTNDLIQAQRSALAAMLMNGVWLETARLMLNDPESEGSAELEMVWSEHAAFGQKILLMLENFEDEEIQLFYSDFSEVLKLEDAKTLTQKWSSEINAGDWEKR